MRSMVGGQGFLALGLREGNRAAKVDEPANHRSFTLPALTKEALTRLPRASATGAKWSALTSHQFPLTNHWAPRPLPETAKRVERRVSYRKQTIGYTSTRDGSGRKFHAGFAPVPSHSPLATRHSFSLTGTRERLELRVSHRKQTIGYTSNRYTSRDKALPLPRARLCSLRHPANEHPVGRRHPPPARRSREVLSVGVRSCDNEASFRRLIGCSREHYPLCTRGSRPAPYMASVRSVTRPIEVCVAANRAPRRLKRSLE